MGETAKGHGAGAGAGAGAGRGDLSAAAGVGSDPKRGATLTPNLEKVLRQALSLRPEEFRHHDQVLGLVRGVVDFSSCLTVSQIAHRHESIRRTGYEYYFVSAGAALRMGDFPRARNQLLRGIATVYSR